MFTRSFAGLAFNPSELQVVVGQRLGSSLRDVTIDVVPLASGLIDPVSGKILNHNALRSVLEAVHALKHRAIEAGSVLLALPSSATLVHSWSEKGPPTSYTAEQLFERVRTIRPERVSDYTIDCYQHYNAASNLRAVTAFIANRDLIRSYVQLLTPQIAIPMSITTGEVARCNLLRELCAEMPCIIDNALVVAMSEGYAELTWWRDGMIRTSERICGEGSRSARVCYRKPGDAERVEQSGQSVPSEFIEQVRNTIAAMLEPSTAARTRLPYIVLMGATEGLSALHLQEALETDSGLDVQHLTNLCRGAAGERRSGMPLVCAEVLSHPNAADAVGVLLSEPLLRSAVARQEVGQGFRHTLGERCIFWGRACGGLLGAVLGRRRSGAW